MSKTDKELAVEVAKAYIESRTIKLATDANGHPIVTPAVTKSEINSVINSTYKTIQSLQEAE